MTEESKSRQKKPPSHRTVILPNWKHTCSVCGHIDEEKIPVPISSEKRPAYQRDELDNLILDSNGQPIPLMAQSMRTVQKAITEPLFDGKGQPVLYQKSEVVPVIAPSFTQDWAQTWLSLYEREAEKQRIIAEAKFRKEHPTPEIIAEKIA